MSERKVRVSFKVTKSTAGLLKQLGDSLRSQVQVSVGGLVAWALTLLRKELLARQAGGYLAIVDKDGNVSPLDAGDRIHDSFKFDPANTPQGVWDEYWKPIVSEKGKVSFAEVKRELYDYHMLLSRVPEVYNYATGGHVSKPHTDAEVMKSLIDEHYARLEEDDVELAVITQWVSEFVDEKSEALVMDWQRNKLASQMSQFVDWLKSTKQG